MNNLQRQLLADKLDELGRRIENYEKAIAELQRKTLVKQTRLHDLKVEQAQLQEGIDW